MKTKKQEGKKRCVWCTDDPLYIHYHDREWGRLKLNDEYLFEMLILEGQQAGLSWLTVLKKRENYRLSLDDFDYRKIASYDEGKVKQLLANQGIIRNHLKIKSIIKNAQVFIEIKKRFSTFKKYLMKFTAGKVYQEKNIHRLETYPSESDLSKGISKDLMDRGMSFVGSTIIFSYLEAIGIYHHHQRNCFLYKGIT